MKKITIEVRDDAPVGKALEGSIRLTSENEAVFHEYNRSRLNYRVMKKECSRSCCMAV